MSQKCEHDHSHEHHEKPLTDSVFKIGISLNLIFVFIEVYVGIIDHSLALVSDAVHNLTDVFGLVLAWLGFALAKKQSLKKFSIYAAVINSALLLITSLWIIKEAYERYYAGEQPVALAMIVVALVGTLINFYTAKQFHHGHHHDLNMKSAYLHLMGDAAISLGVVVAGVVIYFKQLYWIDPVISGVISVIIIFATWGLFSESVNLMRGKTPKRVDLEALSALLLKYGVRGAQQIRVWGLSTSENALSAHIELSPDEKALAQLRHELQHQFKITQIDFKTN